MTDEAREADAAPARAGFSLAALIVLAAGCALAIAAWFFAQSVVEREARFKFESAASSVVASARSRMRSYSDLLYGLQGLFQADPDVSRDAFDNYVYSLDLPVRYPGLRSISYARRILAAERAEFEARLREDPALVRRGIGDVTIRPGSERPEHLVLTYVEPLHANKSALGFDLATDGKRMGLIARARDTGMPALSGPLTLAVDPALNEPGLVMRLALYRKNAFTPDVERRREAFVGLANVTFIVRELAQHMLSGQDREMFTLTIRDAGFIDSDTPRALVNLYSIAALQPAPAGPVFETSLPVDMGQRRWLLHLAAPRAHFLRATDPALPWVALASVLVASLLLSGLIQSLAGSRQRAHRLAARMTADLRQSQARLELEHAVARLLSEERSDDVMPRVLQAIGDALGCACGAYWSSDRKANELYCVEAWSVASAEAEAFAAAIRPIRHPLRLPGGLLMRVWNTGEPVWVDEVTQRPGFLRAPLAAKAGLRGAFAFPVRSGTETLGVMEFFSRARRQPDEAQLRSANAIGSQIGLYLTRKQAEDRIRHLANYDELTGLSNRSMFNQSLLQALARARRSRQALSIMFLDVDRFKNINDTLGHDAGDEVLREIAARLRACLREGDIIGRLGGDEFVVLLESMPQPLHGATVAQKLLTAVAQPISVNGQDLRLTASIGISNYPADGEDLQSLLKYADIAMYRAKEQGKNNYQFYSAQMNVHTLERMALESEMRKALERGEFVLHYQPKVDLGSRRIVGAEALLRWQHPQKGLVPPAQFVPVAEETGMIVPIGEWVLHTACAQSRAWREQGLPPLEMAVNLSARQFAHQGLQQDLKRLLNESGMGALQLEITESMVMHEPERAAQLLDDLKASGALVAIDDFGTGYSSLSYLKRFPIDTLKIDRSFIKDLPADAGDAAITRAIVMMAHSLGMKVVAEGVETQDQAGFLRALGCEQAQGYYFGKPVPAHEFVRMVQESNDLRRAPKARRGN